MNAFLLFPPNFDDSQTYPLLMSVYGGPNSQVLSLFYSETNRKSPKLLIRSDFILMWPLNWDLLLLLLMDVGPVASNLIAVLQFWFFLEGVLGESKFSIDLFSFINIFSQNLGNLETFDKITAVKYFQSLSYVDSNRVGNIQFKCCWSQVSGVGVMEVTWH